MEPSRAETKEPIKTSETRTVPRNAAKLLGLALGDILAPSMNTIDEKLAYFDVKNVSDKNIKEVMSLMKKAFQELKYYLVGLQEANKVCISKSKGGERLDFPDFPFSENAVYNPQPSNEIKKTLKPGDFILDESMDEALNSGFMYELMSAFSDRFNNKLAIIMGFPELIINNLAVSDDLRSSAKGIKSAAGEIDKEIRPLTTADYKQKKIRVRVDKEGRFNLELIPRLELNQSQVSATGKSK